MCMLILYLRHLHLQFCEIVSTDTYSPWAGPIIDVLLDYVGHVMLCSRLIEHLDSYSEWAGIKEKSSTTKPSWLYGFNPAEKPCRFLLLDLLQTTRLHYSSYV